MRWTHDRIAAFGGDFGRIFVMGHSAGAYNAAMLALDARYLAAEGLSRRAIAGAIGLAGPYDFLPLSGRALSAIFGGADDLTAIQPINFIAADAPQFLLLTGNADSTVPPRNTERLAVLFAAAVASVVKRDYSGVGNGGIVASLATPLTHLAPTLVDVAGFVGGGAS